MRAVTQVRLSADYDMTNHGHSNRAKAEVANGRVRSLFPENRIESDGTDLGADGTGGSRQPPRCGGGGGCYVSASARFPAPALDCRQSRLQNSLGCGLNSRFPGEHSVVLDCRLRVLGREDSSGEPRCVERRPSTCLHRHRWMTGPGRGASIGPEVGRRHVVCYVTKRTSWSAVSASTPNMQWHITFEAPRTRTWRPPNSSLRRPLTRSPAVRSL